VILVTAHRQENLGQPLRDICAALGGIADRYREEVRIIYPVHPRPEVRTTAQEILGGRANVILCEPLDYHRMLQLILRCDFLITDSGGLQEEAPSIGRPALVLREVTERPEAVEAGSALLVGTSRERILAEASRLLECRDVRDRMARPVTCYGDGLAARRIVAALLGERVMEWMTDRPDPARMP
jgi:UDP-N-acetylglucosamine 2-epimerase (non-hydrolysing)